MALVSLLVELDLEAFVQRIVAGTVPEGLIGPLSQATVPFVHTIGEDRVSAALSVPANTLGASVWLAALDLSDESDVRLPDSSGCWAVPDVVVS